MSTIAEIKSKYALSNDGAVAITVDVGALRETAKELLQEAKEAEFQKIRSRDPVLNAEWTARRNLRILERIKEQKRNVDMAMKFLGEVSGILDSATETLKKAK